MRLLGVTVLPRRRLVVMRTVPEVIRYTTSKLLWGQTIGGGMGAVVGLLVGLLLRRKGRGVAPPRATDPPTSR